MAQRFHIEEEDLTQYALGTLKDAQLTTLTAHVSICTECRVRLGAIQVELAAYAAALPEEGELPEGSRQRFLSRLTTPATQGSRFEQAREQGRAGAMATGLKSKLLSPRISWALSGVLAAGVVFLLYDDLSSARTYRRMVGDEQRMENDSAAYQELNAFLKGNSHPQQVTLHQSVMVNFAPTAHVTYLASTGRLILTAANMQQLPPGKAYQLWLLPASGDPPVSAGTFVPDLAGNGAIIFPKLPGQVLVKGFGLSAEDANGAAKPTMPWVLNGR